MSAEERYRDAIYSGGVTTIPGSLAAPITWLAVTLGIVAFCVAYLVLRAQQWSEFVVYGIVALAALGFAIVWLVRLVRNGRAFRMDAAGLMLHGGTPIPWAALRRANELPADQSWLVPRRSVVILFTPDGWQRLRGGGFGNQRVEGEPGVKVERMRGCSPEVTARLLTEAIIQGRRSLGLPPHV